MAANRAAPMAMRVICHRLCVGLFDVARHDATLVQITYGTAEQSAQGLKFHLFAADQPLDVTKLYYDVTYELHARATVSALKA